MNEITQIPPSNLDGIETALATVDKYGSQLAPLEIKARGLEVTDAATYAEMGAILSEERSIREQIKATFSPFDAIVNRVKDFLKTQRQKHENTCEVIDSHARGKMKEYEQKELLATKKEQAKAPANATVKPNIPSVAGYRRSTVYRAAVEDRTKFLNAFLKGDKKTKQFLGRFIVIDDDVLAKYYREEHKETPPKVPGVKFWTE